MLDKKVEKCGLSRPQMNMRVIEKKTGVEHNGSIIHICILSKKHEDEYCQCECHYQWRKFHNE
jgi:hypothetical protein